MSGSHYLQQKIHFLFEENHADPTARVQILYTLLKRYLSPSVSLEQEYSKQLTTQNEEITIYRPQYTPHKSDYSHESSIRSRELSNSDDPRVKPFHRLSSELQGIEIDGEVKKHVDGATRKKQKQRLYSMFKKISECFRLVLQILKNSLAHIVCLKYGKSEKFKVEGMYIASLKKIEQDYLTKIEKNKHTEQFIQTTLKFCEEMVQIIPAFTQKFIDPSIEVTVPLPPQLFKTLMQF